MTENKECQDGRKCICKHCKNEYHVKLNSLVVNTEFDKGYLTNNEWADKYILPPRLLDEWLSAECRECDCKQYNPVKRKWEFWK